MSPHIFYRVEDKDSRARYDDGEGIDAEDQYTSVNFGNLGDGLRALLAKHLDWGNRQPSPFISMYCDKSAAWSEARRRVNDGKTDVKICEIDTYARDRPMQYRNVRLLAEDLGIFIPEEAWNKSKYEYVCFRHVPESAVERVWEL